MNDAKRIRRAAPSSLRTSGTALYRQVADALRQDIVRGAHPLGARLPTEAALRKRFGVSRHTVREALRQLREDNLITSRQGAGTEVSAAPVASYAHDVMSINDLSISDLVSWSAGKRYEIASLQLCVLDEQLAARSGGRPGEEWLVVHGTGHADGASAPTCWAEYYIHRDFAAVGRLLPRHRGPIFPLIEDLFGVKVVEVHQEIGAALIEAPLARLLKVRARSAALEVRRSFRLANGRLVQVTVTTHPAARHRHTVTLRRVKS
jgi:GntR family transcriptional regulator